jgi:hypothetical protein
MTSLPYDLLIAGLNHDFYDIKDYIASISIYAYMFYNYKNWWLFRSPNYKYNNKHLIRWVFLQL